MTGSKRVAIVATEFAPAYSWGGPIFSLLRLAKELGAEHEVFVFASTRMEPRSRRKITKAMMDETFDGVANITRYDHVPLIGLSFGRVLEPIFEMQDQSQQRKRHHQSMRRGK